MKQPFLLPASLVFAAIIAFVLLALVTPASPIDAQTVVATIQLSENGFGVGVNPLTGRGYVGMRSKIGVIDLRTDQQLRTVTVTTYSTDIGQIGVNTRTNRIYAVSGWTFVVDGNTEALLGEISGATGMDVAVDETANLIYYGYASSYVSQPDRVYIIDAAAGRQVANIRLGTSYYYQGVRVAANPSTGLAYAAYTRDDSLLVISSTTLTITTRIPFVQVFDVEVDPLANRVYAIDQGWVVVLDGATHAELGRIGGVAGRLLVNPYTGRVYTINGKALAVVDGATRQVLSEITLPVSSSGLHPALDPLTGRIYIPCSGAGWQDKLMVVQDEPAPPTPTPTVTPTPTLTPTPTATPTPTSTPVLDEFRYLPLVVLS